MLREVQSKLVSQSWVGGVRGGDSLSLALPPDVGHPKLKEFADIDDTPSKPRDPHGGSFPWSHAPASLAFTRFSEKPFFYARQPRL